MEPLPDVNVLVALAWPNHIHHGAARVWFLEAASGGWATCPLTESGFVRVSSNSNALEHAVSPGEAIELLRRLRRHGSHSFIADEISLATTDAIDLARLVGYRQVTDAHLLALALAQGSALVTFDRGIGALVPDRPDRAGCVVQLTA